MAYNISLTNGQDLVTVADGTTDTSYTSITLIGKNFAGYGDFLNENLVHILENFANTTEPPNALEGQLWWDTVNKSLKVKSSTGFKAVSSTTTSTSSPANAIIGDLWWDTANGQLKVFSGGTTWVTIGPAYTATQGQTGVIADSIAESSGAQSHVIVKFMVNNTCVAVMSKDPAFTVNTLAGFTTIKPGMNFSSVGNLAYYGAADNALNLGGVAATNYLRGDQASVTNFPLSILHANGLTVGAAGDYKITVSSGAVDLYSAVSNRNMLFRVNASGVPTTLLTLSATDGALTITPTASSVGTAIATKEYVDNSFSGTSSVGLRRDGGNTITGDIVPSSTNTRNFGSASSVFANVYSTNFVGLASNASRLEGFTASQFVRSDVTTTMTAPLTTTSNTGLTLGSSGDFTINVTSSPNSVNLSSNTSGKSMLFNVKVGATATTALSIDGATGLVSVLGNPTSSNGIATKAYVDAVASGGLSFSAVNTNVVPTVNNTYTVGTSGMQFAAMYATTFNGNATTANYADLAERFEADKEYIPGTLVEIGGEKEVTQVTTALSDNVLGVISTDPAYLMNASAGSNNTHPPIALNGRVPVRVVGKVKKGNRLVSAGAGVARAAFPDEVTPFNVIGRALEDKDLNSEGLVLAIVKINL